MGTPEDKLKSAIGDAEKAAATVSADTLKVESRANAIGAWFKQNWSTVAVGLLCVALALFAIKYA